MSIGFENVVAPSPKKLVINVTLKCPLKCAHCCFSSDMFQEGHLSLDDALEAIEQASKIDGFDAVHFVGGDPFLHPDIMAKAYAYAKLFDLAGGATSSAYWAKSYERAVEILTPLVAAGLSTLTLSCDDEHAEFVPIQWVANAARAALDLGVKLSVAVVVGPRSALTAARLRVDLGLTDCAEAKVYEIPLNGTGRASENRLAKAVVDNADLGPCHSALRHFTITHKGDVQPCCGVLPQYDGLVVGNVRDGGVGRAVTNAYDDPLFQWIALKGPTSVLDTMGMASSDCRGICEACDKIFSEPKSLANARRLAYERKEELETLTVALTALSAIITGDDSDLIAEHAS